MRERIFSSGYLALSIAFALTSAEVDATGLQVAPTTLTLSAKQNGDGLWLTNTGTEKLHAQARVYAWTQKDGEEHLEPSRALVISPPMLQLEPGSRQLVRVVRVGTPAAHAEAAFRVIVDELPVDAPASTTSTSAPAGADTNLKFVLRYSVPIFLAADGDVVPDLHTRLLHDGSRPVLEVRNDGGMHAQLGNLVVVDGRNRRKELVTGLLGYVLPGATMRWPLNVAADAFAGGGNLQSRINGEAAEHVLAPVNP